MESKTEDNSGSTKPIFDAIATGDLAEFKNILAQHKGSVDLFDENGMTALQHASYKANKEMVQLLLDRGADVNSGRHEYNYTALHFGALSGNSDVCKLLLDAGANSTATNSVGRTASQMAGFVGNHHTVATINNFIPRSEIAFYSVPQGQAAEPLIPPFLVDPLHKFVLGVNVHPVRLALNVRHTPCLHENANAASKVLALLSKKEMSRGSEKNEVMAFKYHYLSYIMREIFMIWQKPVCDERKHDIVECFSKRLLKPGKDGVSLDNMDLFLKDCIREFPYRECTTFHQLVSSLTCKDPPPALSVVSCTINGQLGFIEAFPYCSTCGEEKPSKKCSKCKSVQYCDRECQRLHWFVHKKACNRECSAYAPGGGHRVHIDVQDINNELQNLVTR